eukprot:jgi/Chrzof1/8411/Cz03g09190.t1
MDGPATSEKHFVYVFLLCLESQSDGCWLAFQSLHHALSPYSVHAVATASATAYQPYLTQHAADKHDWCLFVGQPNYCKFLQPLRDLASELVITRQTPATAARSTIG